MDSDPARLERKLRAFYQLARPGEPDRDYADILSKYEGRETTLFADLDTAYPQRSGWGLVRDAMMSLYRDINHAVSEGDIDECITTWVSGPAQADLLQHRVTGVFHTLYPQVAGDGSDGQRYMQPWRDMVGVFYDALDTESFCQKLPAAISEFRAAALRGEGEQYAKGLRQQTDEMFAGNILELHAAPAAAVEEAQQCLRVGDPLENQRVKMALVRSCQPVCYRAYATFAAVTLPVGATRDPGVLRAACWEFFQVQRVGEFSLPEYTSADELKRYVLEQVELHEPARGVDAAFLRRYRERVESNAAADPALFPPWRMDEYPAACRPSHAPPPVTAAEAGALFGQSEAPPPWSYDGMLRVRDERARNGNGYNPLPPIGLPDGEAPPGAAMPAAAAAPATTEAAAASLVPPAAAPAPHAAAGPPLSRNPVAANLSSVPLTERLALIDQRWTHRAAQWAPLFASVDYEALEAEPLLPTAAARVAEERAALVDADGQRRFDDAAAAAAAVDDAREPPPPLRRELWVKAKGRPKDIRAHRSVLFLVGSSYDPTLPPPPPPTLPGSVPEGDFSAADSVALGLDDGTPASGRRLTRNFGSVAQKRWRNTLSRLSAAVDGGGSGGGGSGLPFSGNGSFSCASVASMGASPGVLRGLGPHAARHAQLADAITGGGHRDGAVGHAVLERPDFVAEDDDVLPPPVPKQPPAPPPPPPPPASAELRSCSLSPLRDRERAAPVAAEAAVATTSELLDDANPPAVAPFLCQSCSTLCLEARQWELLPAEKKAAATAAAAAAIGAEAPPPERAEGAPPVGERKEGKVQLLKKIRGGMSKQWQDRWVVATRGGVQWYLGNPKTLQLKADKPVHSVPVSPEGVYSVIMPAEARDKKAHPAKHLHEAGYTVFGLRCKVPAKTYWMRVRPSSAEANPADGWAAFFARCLLTDKEDPRDDERAAEASWRARAGGLAGVLREEKGRLEARREEAVAEQRSFARQAEATAAAETEKEWAVLTASRGEDAVALELERRTRLHRERDKAQQELAAAAAAHAAAEAECAAAAAARQEAEAVLRRERGAEEAATETLQRSVLLAQKARAAAEAETERIAQLIQRAATAATMTAAAASPNRRLTVPSPATPVRPFSY